MAGIDELNIFGSFSTIHSISLMLHIPFDAVKELQYAYVFLIQWQKAKHIKFQKRLQEIHNQKSQQNGKHK